MGEWPQPEDLPPFQPCVIYWEGVRCTEMILEDTTIVYRPWGPYKGHAVDLGYNAEGKLVGIKIWDDVRASPARDMQEVGG